MRLSTDEVMSILQEIEGARVKIEKASERLNSIQERLAIALAKANCLVTDMTGTTQDRED